MSGQERTFQIEGTAWMLALEKQRSSVSCKTNNATLWVSLLACKREDWSLMEPRTKVDAEWRLQKVKSEILRTSRQRERQKQRQTEKDRETETNKGEIHKPPYM